MICQRCGNDLPENSSICPTCGTVIGSAKKSAQPPTTYGQFPQHEFGARPSNQHGDSRFTPPFSAGMPQSPPHASQQAAPGPIPAQGIPFYYQAQPGSIPFNNSSTYTFTRDTALVAEFILSLFGLFGVGWLIAGSTVTGIILLIGSVFVYWPLMIGGVILTRGLGLLCLGPLAIGAIIINTLLLAMALRRKTARFTVPPPPSGRNQPPF